jgi:hypothetical protein
MSAFNGIELVLWILAVPTFLCAMAYMGASLVRRARERAFFEALERVGQTEEDGIGSAWKIPAGVEVVFSASDKTDQEKLADAEELIDVVYEEIKYLRELADRLVHRRSDIMDTIKMKEEWANPKPMAVSSPQATPIASGGGMTIKEISDAEAVVTNDDLAAVALAKKAQEPLMELPEHLFAAVVEQIKSDEDFFQEVKAEAAAGPVQIAEPQLEEKPAMKRKKRPAKKSKSKTKKKGKK